MPYLDGTGPYGTGPWGRGRGPCRGGGMGMMMRGRGYGRYVYRDAPAPDEQDVRRGMELEVEMLERRLEQLKVALKEKGTGSE